MPQSALTELLESAVQRHVFLMSKEQIEHYWTDIVRVLGEVPGYFDFFTAEWTYNQAMRQDIQVWGFSDGEVKGIAVTQILIFPAQKCFEILGAGGVGMFNFVDDMDVVFEKIAADSGCKTIICRVRPGLARMLARKKRAIAGAVWLYRPVGKVVEN